MNLKNHFKLDNGFHKTEKNCAKLKLYTKKQRKNGKILTEKEYCFLLISIVLIFF